MIDRETYREYICWKKKLQVYITLLSRETYQSIFYGNINAETEQYSLLLRCINKAESESKPKKRKI